MKQRKRMGGHENDAAFELTDLPLHDNRAGFDPGEESYESAEDEYEFPRRSPEAEVPAEPLAERIRRDREED